jgi:hypothetical protein
MKTTKLWEFDHYVNGVQKAQGARVRADTEEEGIKEATRIFSDCPGSTFKLRQPPTQPEVREQASDQDRDEMIATQAGLEELKGGDASDGRSETSTTPRNSAVGRGAAERPAVNEQQHSTVLKVADGLEQIDSRAMGEIARFLKIPTLELLRIAEFFRFLASLRSVGEKPQADGMALVTGEVKHPRELLCDVHKSLDERGELAPFRNCVACIRNHRDELLAATPAPCGISEEELAAMEVRCNAAADGLRIAADDDRGDIYIQMAPGLTGSPREFTDQHIKNAAFLDRARTDMPRLIAELRRLNA